MTGKKIKVMNVKNHGDLDPLIQEDACILSLDHKYTIDFCVFFLFLFSPQYMLAFYLIEITSLVL